MSTVATFRPRTQGDTTALTVFLRRRDIATGEKSSAIGPGDVVTWTLSPAGAAEIVRTGASGLVVDPATGEVRNPLSASDTAVLPLGPVPFRIRVTNTDGVVTTFLRGVVPIEA
jgi:hypothetical protein